MEAKNLQEIWRESTHGGIVVFVRFPEEIDHDVIVRLRRIEGQVRGLQRLVEEGADCSKVVTQLSATKGALDRVGFKLMAAGMQQCMTDTDVKARDAKVAELEKLFLKLS